MASHEEDHLPEETQGYKLSQPKQSIAEYHKMGESITGASIFILHCEELRGGSPLIGAPYACTS
jgi:hypothetical protein